MSIGKVVVIGWDGASWPVIRKYIDEGRLPTLRKFLEEGAEGDLRSTIPASSGPAWTSIVTGVNPGKHNIYDFCRADGYDMKVNNGSYRRSSPIWDIIGKSGKKVAVVNIPMTYPPEPVNGIMVSGMDTPSSKKLFAYPDDLQDLLIKSGYYFITWASEKFEIGKEKEFAQKILGIEKKRGELIVYLLNNLAPDFLIVNFAGTDRIQHRFWDKIGVKGNDAVLDMYEELDSILSRILESIDESTTVLLISDHGFGPFNKPISLGKWLRDQGLLKIKTRIPRYLLRTIASFVEKIGGRAILGIVFKWLPILGSKVETAKLDSWSPDWSKTKVWFPNVEGGLRINLKGRDTGGVVNPGAEYEELRDYVIHQLEELIDPDNGAKVIEKVWRREECYSGPYTANAPDLILQGYDGYEMIKGGKRVFTKRPSSSPKTGTHRLIGVFMASGLNIQRGSAIGEACVYDIAPTILHILGLPVPPYMDGRVLSELFEPGSEAARREVEYASEVQSEKTRIKGKLAKLRGFGKV